MFGTQFDPGGLFQAHVAQPFTALTNVALGAQPFTPGELGRMVGVLLQLVAVAAEALLSGGALAGHGVVMLTDWFGRSFPKVAAAGQKTLQSLNAAQKALHKADDLNPCQMARKSGRGFWCITRVPQSALAENGFETKRCPGVVWAARNPTSGEGLVGPRLRRNGRNDQSGSA